MRLRHLHLQTDRPPLRDVALTFRRETALKDQPLSLHFLIGLNGTGKTRLMQALVEAFIALDRDNAPPTFPLWLAYDRRMDGELRTIYFRHPPTISSFEEETTQKHWGQTALVVFETSLPANLDWDEFATIPPSEDAYNDYFVKQYPNQGHRVRTVFLGNLPGSGAMEAFLPNPLLVYTSGDPTEWRVAFQSRLLGENEGLEQVREGEERPPGWGILQERDYQLREGLSDKEHLPEPLPPEEAEDWLIPPNYAVYIGPEQLPLVLIAVTLEAFKRETRGGDKNGKFYKLMEEVHWGWPVTLTLNIDFQPKQWGKNRAQLIHDLVSLASAIHAQPEQGTGQKLVFDLHAPTPQRPFFNKALIPGTKIIFSLFDLLGDDQKNAFGVFNTLRRWQEDGLLLDAHLSLRKDNKKDPDVLLFEWLSDGERMFLGRMALFLLLNDENDALMILDEPETHFNDAWKRDVVDMIEQALADTYSHVLIASHATILISDAFSDEVILFTPNGPRRVIRTLGAEPSELTEAFFKKPGVGQRAVRRIQRVLEKGEQGELKEMLEKVGPGSYRFALVEKMHNVSQD